MKIGSSIILRLDWDGDVERVSVLTSLQGSRLVRGRHGTVALVFTTELEVGILSLRVRSPAARIEAPLTDIMKKVLWNVLDLKEWTTVTECNFFEPSTGNHTPGMSEE